MPEPIILDAALRRQLDDLTQVVYVHDEKGQKVGVFVPIEVYRHLVKNLKLPISDAELERREQEGGGCSLQEFWQRMERSAS